MTLSSYNSLCDDFYIDMYVNTKLDLPTQRDTILTFFERIQRQFPSLRNLSRRENGEFFLEEDRNLGQFRWVSLELDRIGSAVANPGSFEIAYSQDRLILELMPYMLGVSHLDIDSLDLAFVMDFDHSGNHDEVIAEALFATGPFGCLLDLPEAKAVGFSPAVVMALSEDENTQARICVESKTSVFGSRRKRQGDDEAISLSLTVRQYPNTKENFDPIKSFDNQSRLAEELMTERIIPNFVQPLAMTIAERRST